MRMVFCFSAQTDTRGTLWSQCVLSGTLLICLLTSSNDCRCVLLFTGYSYGNNYALTQAQCNSHVCTVSNDIAKAGLATEALGSLELAAHQPGSVGLQQTKLSLSACSTPKWFW